MSEKRQITLTLDMEVSGEHGDRTHMIAKFSHPDMQGHLYLRAGTENMLNVQLDHLSGKSSAPQDPISVILGGADKILESVKEIKELIEKK